MTSPIQIKYCTEDEFVSNPTSDTPVQIIDYGICMNDRMIDSVKLGNIIEQVKDQSFQTIVLDNNLLGDEAADTIERLLRHCATEAYIVSLSGNTLGPKVVDALVRVLSDCNGMFNINVINTGLGDIDKERLAKVCKDRGIIPTFEKNW
jgi:Ran GTPase-activating protein (RanGAP) involved in mRNA processing and transport